jgi:predicted acyl esterase
LSIEDHYAQIQVPVFSTGAWYDIFLGGTLKIYVRLKTEAGTEAARYGQRLVISVGGHARGSSSGKVGTTAEGVPVKGNFVWSAMDNYEWADGYGRHAIRNGVRRLRNAEAYAKAQCVVV